MDDTVTIAVMDVLGCSFDEAETFLNSESGCYISVGGEQHWLSGQVIRQILEAKE